MLPPKDVDFFFFRSTDPTEKGNQTSETTCSELSHLLQFFLSLGRCNGLWEVEREGQHISGKDTRKQ